MIVISSTEFAANQQKYFDLARHKNLYIRNGENMFIVSIANQQEEHDMIFEPDEDFYRSVSADEFRERLVEVVKQIDQKYAQNASNHLS